MMPSCLFLSICFLSLLSLPSVSAWKREIHVSPSGNDSPSCGSRSRPCQSLDKAFAVALSGTDSANSTLVTAAKGNYTLTKSFNFVSVDTFSLVGMGSRLDEVRITCQPNVSLSFVLCQNVSLEGFMLQKCGGWRESTVGINKSAHAGQRHQGVKFKTALDFRYCRNVLFMSVKISSSPGLGVNFFDVGGVVSFNDCVFADNKALSRNNGSNGPLASFIEEGFVYSGGGIYMILDQYGDNAVNVTPSEHDSFQHNNTYIFTNCYFLRNEAFSWNVSHAHDIIDDSGPIQFSLGGGMSINFRGNASNCNTTIESCVFVGNRAIWGGGLQIETRDKVSNNRFHIKNTSFHENNGTLDGGGVRVGNLLQRGAGLPLNTFIFDNDCSFVNNSAIWGGGMSLYATSVLCKANCDDRKTQFIFNRGVWLGNKGTVGSALAAMLMYQNDVQTGPEVPFSIIFKDCTFSRNQVVKLDEGVVIGEGALYSVQVPLIFQGHTLFNENTNTALSLDGSTIEIFDRVEFISNTGYSGGAVAMRGLSKINFQKNSYLLFYDNSCEHLGGALFIEVAGSPMVYFNATGVDTHECFFGYSNDNADFKDWEITLIFQGNRALNGGKGNSVYITTLNNCRLPGERRNNNTVLKWGFVKFKTLDGNVSSRESQVATDAIDINYEPTDWEVAPSEVFNATVKLIDEVDNEVTGIVEVKINFLENSPPVKLDTASSFFLTNGIISNLRLTGRPGDSFTVTLRYVGRQLLIDTIPGMRRLQQCHAGFVPKGSRCVCNNATDDGIAWCEPDGKTIYLKQGYWAGEVDGKFVTSPCPVEYCSFTKSVFPEEYQYVPGEVCKSGRDQTSILCGRCKKGYGVLMGNENCSSSCENKWLGLIPVYFIALVILTVLVLVFNPNLSGGHLNACLYSYQMVKILTPEGFTYDPFVEFLAALSHLHIRTGDGICFIADLNNADKLFIMAIVAVVELFILIGLTKCTPVQRAWGKLVKYVFDKLLQSRSCPCPGTVRKCWESFEEREKNGFAHAYCSIFVLCFVDITRVSLQLLHPTKFESRYVLFVDGNMEFFVSGKHFAYGIIAIVLMLFVVFLSWKLGLFTGRSEHFNALRVFYKTGRQRFVPFYLVCRLVLLLISTYIPAGLLKSALLQLSCILALFIIAVARPYREEANHEGIVNEPQDLEARRPGGNQAQQVADGGGNEPQQLERLAGEDKQERPAGNEGERIADGETIENRWINESDLVVLATLCAIAVLSSPIGGDVSKSTGKGLMVIVWILSYVPLVVAILPYAIRVFQACRQERVEHVPEQQDQAVPEEPHAQLIEREPPRRQHGAAHEPAADSNEETPFLRRQIESNPLADIPNYETTFQPASEQMAEENDRYYTAQESDIA